MADTDFLNKVVSGDAFTNSEKEARAPFKIDSLVYAGEGKKIKGDDLYKIIQETKAKNVPVASLLHKLPNTDSQIIVTPGPGVVEQTPRSGGKNNK